MVIIDPNDPDHFRYTSPLYDLFCDCGKDLNLGTEENNYYPLSDNKYSNKLDTLMPTVEIWAMMKYQLFIRFNMTTHNTVESIEISWENLSDDEIDYVFMNMYPN